MLLLIVLHALCKVFDIKDAADQTDCTSANVHSIAQQEHSVFRFSFHSSFDVVPLQFWNSRNTTSGLGKVFDIKEKPEMVCELLCDRYNGQFLLSCLRWRSPGRLCSTLPSDNQKFSSSSDPSWHVWKQVALDVLCYTRVYHILHLALCLFLAKKIKRLRPSSNFSVDPIKM